MTMPMIASTWHDFTTFYHHLTQHIIPGPNSISYFVPFISLPIALVIPPSILSHHQLYLVFLPVIFACLAHSTSVGGMDVMSSNLGLWSFVLLMLRDPRRTHKRLRVTDRVVADGREGSASPEIIEESYPEELSKRIPWVLTLLVSLRLTGWRVGETSHDKSQPPATLSRAMFLKHALSTIALSFVIMDVTSWYVQTDPYFVTSQMGVDAPYPAPSQDMPSLLIMLRLLPPRLLRCSVLAGQIYAMVTSMFFIPTIPAVAMNALGRLPDDWSPHTWPVFFGPFSAVTDRGVRGLWGSWWHGLQRQMTATPGRYLAQRLKIATASLLGYALLTISAFFFAGIIHMGMIPPYPESTSISALRMKLLVASFFWVQIPAFGIEIAASRIVSRWCPILMRSWVRRPFVTVWVAAWLCLTLPILPVPFKEIGYWQYQRNYFRLVSVLQHLPGGKWEAW